MNKLIAKIKSLDLKAVIKGFTLIWGLVLIVVMTITNVGIKQEFNFLEWLGNSLILLGIMVFGLLMGESIGSDKQKEKVGGLYQTSLKKYNDFRLLIEPIVMYFAQFFRWFVPQELRDKKINYLVMNNVEINKAEQIVKYCDITDLFDLKGHPIEKIDDKGNKIIIRKLLECEVEPVENVLSGKIQLDLCNYSYYLSAFSLSNSKSVLEIGKQLDKEIKFNKKSNRIVKIMFSLIVSLALGILTVKEFMQGNDAQAWLNLVSRITALITSLFSGWLSSVIDVKLRAEKLSNKTTVLKMFKNSLDLKLFIPLTEEELAKKEYEKYIKEQEQAKKDVVEPEILQIDIEPKKIEGGN